MDQKMELPKGISMQEVMRMANSPAGQQLIRLLQQQGGADFQAAMADASKGNYESVKQSLSSLMSTPEILALLQQLGGKP